MMALKRPIQRWPRQKINKESSACYLNAHMPNVICTCTLSVKTSHMCFKICFLPGDCCIISQLKLLMISESIDQSHGRILELIII